MEYIIGHCVTDVKGCEREIWPTKFAPNLSVGHFVASKNGKVLIVASITHADYHDLPIIKVELCDYRS